jgi:putative MATE family efflux protein
VQVNTSNRDILNMAFPVMIGSFATTLLNITDTAFLGRIGEAELGASAIGGIFYFVFVMVGVSIGTGAQILVARRAGEKNHPAIGAIFDQTMVLLSAISVLLFLLLHQVIPDILRGAVKDKAVADATAEFLRYRSYGIFFIMAATVFRSFYVGIAQPRIYGAYSFLMAGCNIILCYALVFGNLGCPAMGISGAGLASTLSETAGLFFLVVATVSRKNIGEFRLFRFSNLDRSLNSKILELSLPLVIQNLLSMGAWLVFFLFIEKIGKHELAISNLGRGAYMIAMTPVWGFSVAAGSMVSNIIGQQRGAEVMRLVRRIVTLAMIATLITTLLMFVFSGPVLGIFSSDEGLIRDTVPVFRIVLVSMYFFTAAIIVLSALSGTGATRVALFIEITAIFAYSIYIYLTTFIFRSGVETVWLSELVYWTLIGVASYRYLSGGKWQSLNV